MNWAIPKLTVSRRTMLVGVAAALMTVALLVANMRVAGAHQWGSYHWDKGGTQIAIQSYNTATNWQAAENARIDGWYNIGILYDYRVDYHTDISVFDGYYGNTGWVGLASIEYTYLDARCSCYDHIGHVHSRYNMSYPLSQVDIQGIFCQEIAHGWGLGHSNTGDCMGKTYYNQINYYGSHNSLDFYNMYRYH